MILLKNQFKLKRISDAQLSSKNERKTESPVSYFRQENIEKKKEIIEENKKRGFLLLIIRQERQVSHYSAAITAKLIGESVASGRTKIILQGFFRLSEF